MNREILLIASSSLFLSLEDLINLAHLEHSRSPLVPRDEAGRFAGAAPGSGGMQYMSSPSQG